MNSVFFCQLSVKPKAFLFYQSNNISSIFCIYMLGTSLPFMSPTHYYSDCRMFSYSIYIIVLKFGWYVFSHLYTLHPFKSSSKVLFFTKIHELSKFCIFSDILVPIKALYIESFLLKTFSITTEASSKINYAFSFIF